MVRQKAQYVFFFFSLVIMGLYFIDIIVLFTWSSLPDIILASPPLLETTSTKIVTLLISDRIQGIIPTLGSMINSTKSDVNVILIGDADVNEKVRKQFTGRFATFTTMTLEEVDADLRSQGINPIWKWKEYGSSHDASWKNKNTIRLASWDGLETHENVKNHVRFYAPFLSIFRGVSHYFLIDDDILIKTDIAHINLAALKPLDDSKGIVCPCNTWQWNQDCLRFEFKSQEEKILESSVLYGMSPMCSSTSDENCTPRSYVDFIKSVTSNDTSLRNQVTWNFGFCFVSTRNWKELHLTERYEIIMKESYKKHVFPETSLSFGLGVPYLAFGGAVGCWRDDEVRVRDGLGKFALHLRFSVVIF